MKILADSSLPHLHDLFKSPFTLTLYSTEEELYSQLKAHEILICRSTLKITEDLIKDTPIQCIATASSGSDHMDKNALKTHGIQWLDAKGSNADSVAEYMMSIFDWLTRQGLIHEKKVGIIGYGAVGTVVAERLLQLGFKIKGYDPLREANDPMFQSCTMNELFQCQIICIHANLHDTPPFASRELVNMDFLNHLSDQTLIINAARGAIVDEIALLQHMPRLIYCTDVYQNEPHINPAIIQAATLCTPHIAGHSMKAKTQAVVQIAETLYHHYAASFPRPRLLYTEKAVTKNGHHYHPIEDTLQLKKAANLADAFLTLRASHRRSHVRHATFKIMQGKISR